MTHRWFKIHLSTAIVMMFVTGGLLWANLAISTTRDPDFQRFESMREEALIVESGWPKRFRCQHVLLIPSPEDFSIQEMNERLANANVSAAIYVINGVGVGSSAEPLIMYEFLAIDVAMGLAILLAVAVSAELIIHHRERGPRLSGSN